MDCSAAGLGFCLVAEREIMKPFFRSLYQFLAEKNAQDCYFQVGDITIKARSKHTLGHLPILLANQWQSLRPEILALNQPPYLNHYHYQTITYGSRVSMGDRRLVKNFLNHWSHPLADWLKRSDAASIIDEIRQLRNRATHSEDIFYPWQFERLRLLIVGSKTKAT